MGDATFIRLRQHVDAAGVDLPAHYLAIPPALFGTVITKLGEHGLADRGRVIVEKPFGRDLASAQELSRIVHHVFCEDSIYRIDHPPVEEYAPGSWGPTGATDRLAGRHRPWYEPKP